MQNAKGFLIALVALAMSQPVLAQDGALEQPPTTAGDFCCYDQPFWTWQAGVEATYLSLEMRALEENNPFELPIPLGFEAAPRIWLQAQNANGFGGQVRYWQYDAEASEDAIFSEVVTAGITTDISISQAASVEMYAVDAEATRVFQLGGFDMTASLGGRHAAIGSETAASFFVLSGPSLFDAGAVHYWSDFHGGGITASLAGVLPLGASPWSLFGNVRGSVLWGHEHRAATTTLMISGVGVGSSSGSHVIEDAELGILEAQAGGQWEHPLAWNRGLLFVRLAFEYQAWNVTATLPAGPLDGTSQLDADLYGISCAAGIVY